MEKHVLVTLREGADSLQGARFVSGFFGHSDQLRLTLYHLQSGPGDGLGLGNQQKVQPLVCDSSPKSRLDNPSLERARQLLCGGGFRTGQMDAKTVVRQYTRIMDVIMEAQKGLYDALVLGPQEFDGLYEAFGQREGRAVLEQRSGAPCWLCREIEDGRRDVLLCVDGSGSSLSMSDHVGFMLQDDPRHKVVVLAVNGSGSADHQRARQAMEASLTTLLEAGLDEERLDARMVQSEDIPQVILDEADAGRFAVVAMGRTGAGQGRLPSLFMGSASDRLYRDLSGASLWVCR